MHSIRYQRYHVDCTASAPRLGRLLLAPHMRNECVTYNKTYGATIAEPEYKKDHSKVSEKV